MVEIAAMPARFCLQDLLEGLDQPMSQSELARRSGISFATINAIANNRTKQVQLETLDRLAKVLKVAPGDLITSKPARGRR